MTPAKASANFSIWAVMLAMDSSTDGVCLASGPVIAKNRVGMGDSNGGDEWL
jgi:hypothetical protein